MLNEFLMDEKDREIARLNLLIERYKKYDKERMEYVRNLEQKYADLKSDMEECGVAELKERLTTLRKQYADACRKLQIMKCPEFIDEFDEKELKDAVKMSNLKRQLAEERKNNKELRRINDNLMYRLNAN